jgi:hypothetical protein
VPKVKCPKCKGKGWVTCDDCKGRGELVEVWTLMKCPNCTDSPYGKGKVKCPVPECKEGFIEEKA